MTDFAHTRVLGSSIHFSQRASDRMMGNGLKLHQWRLKLEIKVILKNTAKCSLQNVSVEKEDF